MHLTTQYIINTISGTHLCSSDTHYTLFSHSSADRWWLRCNARCTSCYDSEHLTPGPRAGDAEYYCDCAYGNWHCGTYIALYIHIPDTSCCYCCQQPDKHIYIYILDSIPEHTLNNLNFKNVLDGTSLKRNNCKFVWHDYSYCISIILLMNIGARLKEVLWWDQELHFDSLDDEILQQLNRQCKNSIPSHYLLGLIQLSSNWSEYVIILSLSGETIDDAVSPLHTADHLADLVPANSGGAKGDKVPVILPNLLRKARVQSIPKNLASSIFVPPNQSCANLMFW